MTSGQLPATSTPMILSVTSDKAKGAWWQVIECRPQVKLCHEDRRCEMVGMGFHLPQTVIVYCPRCWSCPRLECIRVAALSPLLLGSVCVNMSRREACDGMSVLTGVPLKHRGGVREPTVGVWHCPRQGAWFGGITKKCILLLLAETGSI